MRQCIRSIILLAFFSCILSDNFAVFAQVRATSKGDGICEGSGYFQVKEVLPEKIVHIPIPLPFDNSKFAQGQVIKPPPMEHTTTPMRCKYDRNKYVAEIKLILTLETELLAVGVPHPKDPNRGPRTQAGFNRTKEHEARHRKAFRDAFNRYKNKYKPLIKTTWNNYPNCQSELNLIRKEVENDWAKVKKGEYNHDTPEWKEWLQNNPSIW